MHLILTYDRIHFPRSVTLVEEKNILTKLDHEDNLFTLLIFL